jgi:hypothetical protein
MCEPGDGFGGREPISKDPHTRSFVGIRPAAQERRCAAGRVNQGRWVYEGEEKERGAARWDALEMVRPGRCPSGPGTAVNTAAQRPVRGLSGSSGRPPRQNEGADGDEGSRTLSHIITGR